jgi:hypothetical protein
VEKWLVLSIPREIATGLFGALHRRLRDQIDRHGRNFEPNELVERATGGPMSMEPYFAYLCSKYGEIYRLPPLEKRCRELNAPGGGVDRIGRGC